ENLHERIRPQKRECYARLTDVLFICGMPFYGHETASRHRYRWPRVSQCDGHRRVSPHRRTHALLPADLAAAAVEEKLFRHLRAPGKMFSRFQSRMARV